MAETEFTFESEQILESQKKKKVIIIGAIIAAAAALVALGVILIIRTRNKTHKSEEGMKYAFSWKENSEGGIDLTLDQSSAPGYCWVLQSVTSEELKVLAPAEQNAKSASFTLVMDNPGVSFAFFTLQNTADPSDRLYEMQFGYDQTADEDGKLSRTLRYVYGRAILQTLSGGEKTEHPYLISEDSDGRRYIVHIMDREEYISEPEIQEYLDPETGKVLSREEYVNRILEFVKNGNKPDGEEDADGDGEAEWRDPFTGELVTEEEWRKIVLEHLDELLEQAATETEEEPEPQYRMHDDWVAVSSDESVISVWGIQSQGLTEDIYEIPAESDDGSGNEAEQSEETDMSLTESFSPFGGESDMWVSCTLARGEHTGSCTVTIRSETAGAAVILDFQIAEDGTLDHVDHRLETFEPALRDEESTAP